MKQQKQFFVACFPRLLGTLFLGCAALFSWPAITFAQNAEPRVDSPTLARIEERGFLIAGVRYDASPFGDRDDNGQPIGFEIDLMHGLAERLLGDADKVEFVQVTASDRITKLLNSEVDIIAATMTYTPQRDENIDFSQTYFLDGQNLLVRSDAEIKSVEDLQGKKIATVQGSTSLERIKTYLTDKAVTSEIILYNKYTEAIQPLLAGDLDAITSDRGILQGIAQAYPNELVVLLPENFTQDPYGLGLPPGDEPFTVQVNRALQAMQEDKTYATIYNKWFPGQTPFVIESPSAMPIPIATAVPSALPTATGTFTAALTLPLTATAIATVPMLTPTATDPAVASSLITVTPDTLPITGAAPEPIQTTILVLLVIVGGLALSLVQRRFDH